MVSFNKGRRGEINPFYLIGFAEVEDDVTYARKKYKAPSNNAIGYASMAVNEMEAFCNKLNKNICYYLGRFQLALLLFGTLRLKIRLR